MKQLLERECPEREGLCPEKLEELYRFLSAPALGLHSLMVVRGGKVVAEGFWAPYAPEKPHTLFSASKSFTGMAVGFAVGDGLLTIEDRVVDWFADRLPARTCENMERMRIRDLLTMSTGFAKDPHDFPWPRPDDVVGTGPHCCHKGVEPAPIDWVRNFFDHYVPYEPGTEFAYCTHASYLLAVIVQRACGKTMSAYLNEKLFEPLGIGRPFWEVGPDGYNVGGWGLSLTTEQLAAVGQMLLDGGVWKGNRILDASWIREMSSVQIRMPHLHQPHIAGYGYQVWIDDREGAFLFKGAFGQMCAVIPGKDMVLAFTSGADIESRQIAWDKIWELAVEEAGRKSVSDAKTDAQTESGLDAGAAQRECRETESGLDACSVQSEWDETESGSGANAVQRKCGETESAAQASLRRALSSLRIEPSQGIPSWKEPKAAGFSGVRYLLGDNRLNFDAVAMRFATTSAERDALTLTLMGKSFTVPVGYGEWLEGTTCVRTEETDTDVSVIFEHVSCSGAWKDGKYLLLLCFDETSYINTMEFSFGQGGLILKHSRNGTFFAAVNTTLTGAKEQDL